MGTRTICQSKERKLVYNAAGLLIGDIFTCVNKGEALYIVTDESSVVNLVSGVTYPIDHEDFRKGKIRREDNVEITAYR